VTILAVVFTALADAQTFQASIDGLAGYPAPSVPEPGSAGLFPKLEPVTLHEAAILAHPSGLQWAHAVTPRMQQAGMLAAVAKAQPSLAPALAAPTPLDATWIPPPTLSNAVKPAPAPAPLPAAKPAAKAVP
jgi:hypothetical protein